jgi:hypothetical protein
LPLQAPAFLITAPKLILRSAADNNLAHIDIGRLLDREHDGRAIASDGIANLSRAPSSRAFTSGLVTPSAKFARTNPGEMIVTRTFSPASMRNPSEIARTANFVAE